MTAALVPAQGAELDRLAKEINEAHHEVEASFGHSLQHAIRAGELLEKAASKLKPRGEWMKWHEANIKHSLSTSDNYRNVYANRTLLLANSEKVGNLGLIAALRTLRAGTPMLQSGEVEWWTPRQYIDAAREVMGEIDLDPASCPEANKTVGAKKFYAEDNDGLSQRWFGRVWLNPPYGKLGPDFAAKLYESLGSGVTEAIVLVNSRATDADWFQPAFNGVLCFTDHRIDFDSPYEKPTSSTHGSCFIYFGPNKEKFATEFSRFGNVVRRWP